MKNTYYWSFEQGENEAKTWSVCSYNHQGLERSLPANPELSIKRDFVQWTHSPPPHQSQTLATKYCCLAVRTS